VGSRRAKEERVSTQERRAPAGGVADVQADCGLTSAAKPWRTLREPPVRLLPDCPRSQRTCCACSWGVVVNTVVKSVRALSGASLRFSRLSDAVRHFPWRRAAARPGEAAAPPGDGRPRSRQRGTAGCMGRAGQRRLGAGAGASPALLGRHAAAVLPRCAASRPADDTALPPRPCPPPLPHGAHCQVVLVAAVGLMHSGSKIGLLQAEPARMAFVNGE